MDKISGIYKIENKINNKFYIGSSSNMYFRWKNHSRTLNNNTSKCRKLQAAWNKYGKDNFEFILLEECKEDELLIREQFYLDSTECLINGYNIAVFAEAPSRGMKHTEQSKLKMSIAVTGRKASDETREKIRQANLGRKQSKENVAKRAAYMLGNKYTLGFKHSEETKNNMRQRMLGNTYGVGRKLPPKSIDKREATKKQNRELKFKSIYQQMIDIIGNLNYGK